MKRIFDLVFGFILFTVFSIPMIIISIFIKLDSNGPIIYFSNRIGQNNKIFKMLKFRTMYTNTPQIGSNELNDPEKYITSLGKYLRKFSLDELPQIINVMKGSMSIVGPRPALKSQKELIDNRKKLGISKLKPGITGLAQVKGRDNISLKKKIEFDLEYLKKNNLLYDLRIIFKTALAVLNRKDISH